MTTLQRAGATRRQIRDKQHPGAVRVHPRKTPVQRHRPVCVKLAVADNG